VSEEVLCGICGIRFSCEEDYEKHVFKPRGYRWCGVKVLRLIEETDELAEKVLERG